MATTGINAAYYYTRFYSDIEAVARYALTHFDTLKAAAVSANALVDASPLSDDQKFMLAQAIRSYYGSTQFLIHEGKPLWIVILRQWLGRFVRRTLSFSKTDQMHENCLRLFLHEHNKRCLTT